MELPARRILLLALAAALLAPASAYGDVLSEYTDLAERELEPAPLVPTTAPRAIGGIDRAVEAFGNRRRSGYGLRLVHYGPGGPDAVIAFQGGTWKGMRGGVREFTRSGLGKRRTRVRGHAGYFFKGPRSRVLLWREDGVVYWMGTGQPRKISVRGLRRTADGLERLGGAYAGSGEGDDYATGAVIVTTETTVTAHVDWGAPCFAADGSERAGHAGNKRVTLLPRDGAAFTSSLDGGDWTGTVSGTVRDGAVDVTVRAVRSADGETCDTGAVAFTARPIEPI